MLKSMRFENLVGLLSRNNLLEPTNDLLSLFIRHVISDPMYELSAQVMSLPVHVIYVGNDLHVPVNEYQWMCANHRPVLNMLAISDSAS